jgi:cyclophilin family peptidyl-prolyl cis-trans isomerase
MADHKEATEVTIAATTDQGEFTTWVLKWWKAGALALAVGAGALMVNQYQQDEAQAADVASWESLGAILTVDNPASFAQADAGELASLATSSGASIAGPWTRYLEASVRDESGDMEGAASALTTLAVEHPDHLLNSMRVTLPGEGTPLTLVERMSIAIHDQSQWEAAHPTLFSNPSPADDAPRVRIVTTEGPIVVALYADEAPKHVENFLKLCSEGFYDETKFHRVIAGFMVQGGDPNSKDVDVNTWGMGGPGYKVDREENDLRHFEGYLAAAKMGGETQSSGSQFYFTTGAPHHLDGQHVVFGKVVEGADTVSIIDAAFIVPGTSRPETPATITSTTVL